MKQNRYQNRALNNTNKERWRKRDNNEWLITLASDVTNIKCFSTELAAIVGRRIAVAASYRQVMRWVEQKQLPPSYQKLRLKHGELSLLLVAVTRRSINMTFYNLNKGKYTICIFRKKYLFDNCIYFWYYFIQLIVKENQFQTFTKHFFYFVLLNTS